MAIIKYKRPNTDVFSRSYDDLFNEFFTSTPNLKRDGFIPSVDISETSNQFEFLVGLPGLAKEDIQVNLERGLLTISGERKFENQEKDKNFHRLETKYGSFNRTFHLPDSLDEESIKANLENGILAISILKTEDKTKKNIEII